jgi:hypothetical protein
VNQPGAVSLAVECRRVVDELADLKKDVELPEHYIQDDLEKRNNEFDPKMYFPILKHLTMISGYELDFVYYSDYMGGKPLLYARETGQVSVKTYEALMAAWGEEVHDESSYATLYHAYDYLEYLAIDGSPESYFDYVTMALQGDQFYLFWHGLYHDTMILCDPGDLAAVQQDFEVFGDSGIKLPDDIAQQAEKIDYTPIVVLTEDTVMLRLVTFSKWGGFRESIYTFERDNPLNVLDAQFNPLIEYDCQVSL